MSAIIGLLCAVLIFAVAVVVLATGFCWGWVLGAQHERLKRDRIPWVRRP